MGSGLEISVLSGEAQGFGEKRVRVEGMGISDFGMQIAGKEGAGFRGKTVEGAG